MVKIGKVSSVDEKKGTARVLFPDRGESVSGDLFIIVPFTLSGKAYYMPSVNERVVCVFDDRGTGFIIGSFYADSRLPPLGDKNKAYVDFNDGTVLRYDKKEKLLDIICDKGEINIAGKKVNIIER
ncbi:MAG: phage baseplate assembly protein V [Clostridiales bacterium]|nr:phage baseplate assembly protein V [Clostridiales bacterium]